MSRKQKDKVKAKKQNKKVQGFKMNKKTGHPSFAFWQKDKQVHSVGFTHNKEDKAPKEQLKHNINPKDDSSCFVKKEIEIQLKGLQGTSSTFKSIISQKTKKSITK